MRAAGVWLPPYHPPPPHPPASGDDRPPSAIDVTLLWEVDSAHRFAQRQGGGQLQRVGPDHGLTPCDIANPNPPPLPPWRPCHLVMWSPPARRGAGGGGAASADDDDDDGPPRSKDRPYFLSELSDLTIWGEGGKGVDESDGKVNL